MVSANELDSGGESIKCRWCNHALAILTASARRGIWRGMILIHSVCLTVSRFRSNDSLYSGVGMRSVRGKGLQVDGCSFGRDPI